MEEWFASLLGTWRGDQQLYTRPEELTAEGHVIATTKNRLGSRMIEIEYTHSLDQEDYVGLFILTAERPLEAAWFDSYHTKNIMHLTGKFNENKLVLAGGFYYKEQFWKWTVEIEAQGNTMTIRHYNHPPEMDRYLGVDVKLRRET